MDPLAADGTGRTPFRAPVGLIGRAIEWTSKGAMDQICNAAPDDATLVEWLRRGDRGAAALLMRRHNRALWRIARGILRHDADAEDAVQEAYLRAFARIHEFRGDSSLRTWLARIVINEALRLLGARRVTADLPEVAEGAAPDASWRPDLAPPPQDPERAAARQELRRRVEQAVDALPAPFRLVFVMRVIEQASVEETAAALGIPQATVKTRLHRANRMLRQTLGDELAAVFDGGGAFPFGGARCERLTRAVLSRLRFGGVLCRAFRWTRRWRAMPSPRATDPAGSDARPRRRVSMHLGRCALGRECPEIGGIGTRSV
jgi:RNA polymerase sigma-70 factor (ECF subfamily)